MSNKEGKQSERAAQRAQAEALQKQIDELVSGGSQGPPPEDFSFRDFVNRKMAEDEERKTLGQAPPVAKREKPEP